MSNLQSKIINGHQIRYIFKPNRKDNAHLVVLFNGYRHWGWDFENSINFFKCNILMIDDFFENFQSCYLGKDGVLNFSDIVHNLIIEKLNDLGLPKSQCTLIGPSKGGFAALYIGLKYDFVNIVAPSFVGHIGTWMINYNKNIASHVMGENYSEETIKFYDELLIELIKKDKNKYKNIYVFLSSNDHFYLEYGQQSVVDFLNNKYENFNVFFTKSQLSFQHDQVATYFLQEILSVTNLLTQGIPVKLPRNSLDDIKTNILFTPNDSTIKLLEKRKENVSQTIVPTNEIHKLKIENEILFIEGLAYLKNYDSPNYKFLHKYLSIENINNVDNKLIFLLGTVPKRDQSRLLYNNIFYDYTAAGTATLGFKGIDLSHLPSGTYKIGISVSNNENEKSFKDLNLKQETDSKSIFSGFEYRLFNIRNKNSQQTFLSKRPLINENNNFYGYFCLESYWTNDFKFHVEGAFIVKGVNLYKFHIGNYYLALRNTQNGQVYSYVLGQVLKPNLSNKIGNPYGGYESSYFASMGFEGVDVSGLKIGQYEVFISLSYQNEIFTQKIEGHLDISQANCLFMNY